MSEYPEQKVINRYSRAEFQSRLCEILSRTNMYEGTLDTSFHRSRKLDLELANSQPNFETTPQHREQIGIAIARLVNTHTERTVIEAAHVYANDDLDDPALQASLRSQARHAAVLGDRLSNEGIGVSNVLFIDNYNVPTDDSGSPISEFSERDLVSIVRSEGYEPSRVFYEADMVPPARAMINHMRDVQGLVKVEGSGESEERTLLAHKGYELYRAGDDKVSCAMLDAALTLMKLHYMGDTAVNVLPARPSHGEFSYRGQQKKMRMIICEHLNVRVIPLINIFTGNVHDEAIAAGAHHTLRKPTRKTDDRS